MSDVEQYVNRRRGLSRSLDGLQHVAKMRPHRVPKIGKRHSRASIEQMAAELVFQGPDRARQRWL